MNSQHLKSKKFLDDCNYHLSKESETAVPETQKEDDDQISIVDNIAESSVDENLADAKVSEITSDDMSDVVNAPTQLIKKEPSGTIQGASPIEGTEKSIDPSLFSAPPRTKIPPSVPDDSSK